jgi:hypothetical protein
VFPAPGTLGFTSGILRSRRALESRWFILRAALGAISLSIASA